MDSALETTFPWTVAELQARYGNVPLERLCIKPGGTSATAADVQELYAAGHGLFELDRGLLIRKPNDGLATAFCERLTKALGRHIRTAHLLLGPMAAFHPDPQHQRILHPDLSLYLQFKSGGVSPEKAIATLAPDLVVEVIRPGNTGEEMELKLQEYFSTGVRLVWYAYPRIEELHAYSNLEMVSIHNTAHTLTAGDLLPGFSLPLAELFASSQA